MIKNFDLPQDKTRSSSEQIIFLKDKKYRIKINRPLKTIDRLDLGQYQLNKLKDTKNTTILRGAFVKMIRKDKVITNKGNFYYQYLVGADGSSSIVRKYLGLKSEVCIGLYYNVVEVTNNFVWYLNPELLKSGYIWVFPHKGYTNIGIYFNPKYLNSQKARKVLGGYIKNNGYKFSGEILKGASINYLYQGCTFGNIFLVGDAAGLASRTSGEGISFALVSGEEIGKRILCPGYKMLKLKQILKIKKRQERMIKIWESFPIICRYPLLRLFIKLMKTNWFQDYFGN